MIERGKQFKIHYILELFKIGPILHNPSTEYCKLVKNENKMSPLTHRHKILRKFGLTLCYLQTKPTTNLIQLTTNLFDIE
jgi:hypothetical protein